MLWSGRAVWAMRWAKALKAARLWTETARKGGAAAADCGARCAGERRREEDELGKEGDA